MNGAAQIFAIVLGFLEFILRIAFVLALVVSIMGILVILFADDLESIVTPYLWRLLR